LYSNQTVIDKNKISPKKRGSTILVESTGKETRVQEITEELPYHLEQRILSKGIK
jgi:hypothetical protein